MMDGSGGMFFGGILMWIFWLLVIVVIIVAVKAMTGSSSRDGSGKDSALSLLEKRYARGEIDREEYQEKKRELED